MVGRLTWDDLLLLRSSVLLGRVSLGRVALIGALRGSLPVTLVWVLTHFAAISKASVDEKGTNRGRRLEAFRIDRRELIREN